MSIAQLFKEYRTSARLAMALRLASMLVGSIASLVFTRLLLHSMGASLYGAFLSFSALTRLGGLGDLGLGSGLATRANIMIGERKERALEGMLQSARSLLLLVALGLFLMILSTSTIAPQWLGFTADVVNGSPALLFAVASITCSVFVLAGYFHALNFACGTVTWPIVPTLLIGQLLAPAFHLVFAIYGFPLWVQCLPYTGSTILCGLIAWLMLRAAQPQFAELLPLAARTSVWRTLAATSIWSFLTSLGAFIFLLTDRLIINIFFGPLAVPSYVLNYKLCELAIAAVSTAIFVSLPRITLCINSNNAADKKQGAHRMMRVNLYQTTAGVAIAMAYLLLNDFFVALWVGPDFQASLALQIIFATILVVYVGGDAATMVASRCGSHGVKLTGIAAGLCGIANLVLSILAASKGSIAGIAGASLVAQSALAIWLGFTTCRYLHIPAKFYLFRSWLLPVVIVLLAGLLRFYIHNLSVVGITGLALAYIGIFAAFCRLAGWSVDILKEELRILLAGLSKSLAALRG